VFQGLTPMTADPETSEAEPDAEIDLARRTRSDRLLKSLLPFERVVLVSHVNPDPDSLASMLGMKALVESTLPGKRVILTVDGMIARSENRAMVELIPIPLVPVETVVIGPETAVIMVDTQPFTGRRFSEAARPQVVIDHHETGGVLDGVLFRDIRTHLGATSTMVTGYLIEQRVLITPELATALLYGIESETTGYPRESSSLDDGAQIWLFPRANKDLLAKIRNPKLPQSHFATFQHALANAFIYDKLVFSWCGMVTQPDIVAEIAEFFVRFEQVNWSLAAGAFNGLLKLSLRAGELGCSAGEILYIVVNELGNAGGHDRRAGGAIILPDHEPETVESLLRTIRGRLLNQLHIDEHHGRRLLSGCSVIPAP
jgi:nanoRNase/pAp phosphatase (c-di-AMP/oligoRNAs hydrolase)